MPDRESTIQGLTHISGYLRRKADIAVVGKGRELFDCWYRTTEDAIALLREQEPVEPRYEDYFGRRIARCGNCNSYIVQDDRFCSVCGKEVKWDD